MADAAAAPDHAVQDADAQVLLLQDADAQALLLQAWELCYLDPTQARAIGNRLADAGGPLAAEGWLHVALADVRIGETAGALAALARAREGFLAMDGQADAGAAASGATASAASSTAVSATASAASSTRTRGLALCDEVQAIALRRHGDVAAAAQLQAELDARGGFERDAMHSFIGHNSRAITAKLLGRADDALRHFYAATDAALRTGWPGPHITALSNLGGYQQDLFNLDDARRLSEQAMAAAREAGASQQVLTSASNLVLIHYAAGDLQQARAMAEFLLTHAEALIPGALQRYALPVALGHLASGEIDTAMQYLAPGAVGPVADGDAITFWTWLMARCLLARGDAVGARELAERTLLHRRERHQQDQPYDLMSLKLVLADACERSGDPVAALGYLREAHFRYEHLVGRSARARYIALEVSHQLAQAERERDLAVDGRRTVEDDHRRLADLNAALQAQIAQTEMLHARLREQALRDPLTGLHNRRYLFEMAPGLLELARRQGTSLCVVLLDLDHFKLLNDTYGHAAGDLVLQRFSGLLTQMLRRSDVVVRHGGEEFVAVMPDIDGEGAQVVLTRLLESFQAQQPEIGRRRLPRGSFSAGIALFPRHGNTLEQLLSRADRGLYAAKNHGRARIELAPKTGFGSLG